MKIGYISKLSNLHAKTDRAIINCPHLGMLAYIVIPPTRPTWSQCGYRG